jgi:predicted MPP superfamily phosphohydrolase
MEDDDPGDAAPTIYASSGRMRMSRRHWLALAAGAMGSGLAIEAFGPAAREVLVTRRDVYLPNLPEAFDGVRVAQVTDVHLPANGAAAAHALALLASERPEIVLHTGDLLEDARAAAVLADFARRACGSLATFATMGNWEWWARFRPEAAREAYRAAGVDLLVNQHAVVEREGARLVIIGLDDAVRGRPDVDRATERVAPDDARIWLAHAPVLAPALPRATHPALVLSGHTHGGQILLPFVPALTPRGSGTFVSGSYDVAAGELYVSRGVGTSGIRARLRCPAELPIFVLRRGQPSRSRADRS